LLRQIDRQKDAIEEEEQGTKAKAKVASVRWGLTMMAVVNRSSSISSRDTTKPRADD
jgi:hypothetical protein